MMAHYQYRLSTNGILPENIETFRLNSITREAYVSFVRHPDCIELVRSTGDITTTPPTNTGLVFYSPAYYFKKNIKRDTSLFTTFKEGKYWDNWCRKTIATDISRDID